MKTINYATCFFLFLWLTAPLNGVTIESEQNAPPLKIYLCSRLTEDAKQWNNVVTQELNDFHVFRPQDVELKDIPSSAIDFFAFKEDFHAMAYSDLLLVLPPYGRDCAWEIGWFCGNQKPAIAYVESQGDWLKDAMIKGGLTAIITNNQELFLLLLKDPATFSKSYYVANRSEISQTIKHICSQRASKRKILNHF